MDKDTTHDAIKVELLSPDQSKAILSQVISLGISIAGIVALIYIQRKASGPDFFRELHGRGLLVLSRFAHRQAEQWKQLGAKADTAYLHLVEH